MKKRRVSISPAHGHDRGSVLPERSAVRPCVPTREDQASLVSSRRNSSSSAGEPQLPSFRLLAAPRAEPLQQIRNSWDRAPRRRETSQTRAFPCSSSEASKRSKLHPSRRSLKWEDLQNVHPWGQKAARAPAWRFWRGGCGASPYSARGWIAA